MRILCLTPWFPNHKEGQIGNFILDSIESLRELGHEVVVLVTRPWKSKIAGEKIRVDQFSHQFKLYACHYFSIPRSRLAWISHGFYRKRVNPLLEKLVQQYNCDIIHAHTELAGITAADVGRKLHVPTVMTMHGISTEKKLYSGRNRKLLFEYTLSNINRVVLVGQSLINFSKVFVKNQDHFRIVGNGFRACEKNAITIEKQWPENNLRFISVSNLNEGKRIDINLLALAQLKKKGFAKWTYKIVGDGVERKKLEILADKLNIKENIIFLGSRDHNEVYTHLVQSDVFILPSYREAFGVAYLEAMSYGLLTIGIQGQGPEAFIEHEKTGFLIAPRDIEALANTIETIFTSPNKMHEIAMRGKEHVHKHFTWLSHAKNLETIYKELIIQ